jgi:N-acetylglucosaminyl-diphospho-decaprenol L-rhamnosyltransferase
MVALAVVVVTWNVRDLALQTLASLYADLDVNGPDADVYVVDSASTDGTTEAIAQAFPRVKLLASDTNLGFAGGNNYALRHMGFGQPEARNLPNAVYFLNPDTITQPGATRTLYDALMAAPDVGLVGARLSYGDGSFQHGAFHFPGLKQLWVEFFPTPGRLIDHPFNGRYPRVLYETGRPFSIDFPLGATFMLKREVIQQTGVFDEQFFMYCEEIDWAWRIRKAGWKAQCAPAAHVVHLGGQSTSQVRPRSVIDLWTSRLRLYQKHYPLWKALIARLMVAIGMRLRARRIAGHPALEPEGLTAAYKTVSSMALR